MPTQPWWQRGAIYQIYPRSFADSDGDGVGDLRGIAAHLDHLNDGTAGSLGVEAIWLSPFYRSPMADFGYDVADHCDVDPVFGTLADFDELVAEAHARSIRVVIDFVPNHSSDRHPWFVQSRSGRESPRRDWYVWRDGRDGGPPDDRRSVFKSAGPAWTLDPVTGQWYRHTFLPQQPDLNWANPEVRAAMHDVLRFWMDRDVDGFRIDVAHSLDHEQTRGLRRVVDEYPDRMLVGEVYLLDLDRVLAYVTGGDELHMAHNFTFLWLDWDAAAFRAAIDHFEALAGEAAWPAWFLANHDHPRVASRFDTDGHGAARARAVLVMLYALRGTPFVYQGEELALVDAQIPPQRVVDVDGRDPERAPIPWQPPSQAGPGAGFTTGEPWLPLVAQAESLNVAGQSADPASALNLARRLAWLRRGEPALQRGAQHTLDAGPDVLAWTRAGEDGQPAWLAAVNFAAEPRPLPGPGRGRVELSSDPRRCDDEPVLSPSEAVLVRLT